MNSYTQHHQHTRIKLEDFITLKMALLFEQLATRSQLKLKQHIWWNAQVCTVCGE
jgi:hypothetical protein